MASFLGRLWYGKWDNSQPLLVQRPKIKQRTAESRGLAAILSKIGVDSLPSSQKGAPLFERMAASPRDSAVLCLSLGPPRGVGSSLLQCLGDYADFAKIMLPLWREHHFRRSCPPKIDPKSDAERQRQRKLTKIVPTATESDRVRLTLLQRPASYTLVRGTLASPCSSVGPFASAVYPAEAPRTR